MHDSTLSALTAPTVKPTAMTAKNYADSSFSKARDLNNSSANYSQLLSSPNLRLCTCKSLFIIPLFFPNVDFIIRNDIKFIHVASDIRFDIQTGRNLP